MRESEISTTVNGRQVKAVVENRLTLADFLREKLRLTGTKVSCESQVCGACTALVDGAPVSTCTTLATDADGAEVSTVEGLASDDDLDPIQQAFVDCTAMQCGFCTPGFIMSTKALLDRHPAPTREEIVHALEGNLCRCTGYLPIIKAVEQAARRRAGTHEPEEEQHRPGGSGRDNPYRVVGHPVPRVDARAKVTGAAQFAVDVTMPEALEGVVVRSDRAHATITGIETKAALDWPGCVTVVTGADLESAGLFPRFGHMVPDHPILAVDRVRYFGEPVALVIGTDRRTAYDAARLVEVRYEDRDAAMHAEAALAADAPAIHDEIYRGESIAPRGIERAQGEVNVAHTVDLAWGDVDAAFREADVVVETSAAHPPLYAFAMEPYNANARFVEGHLEVVSPAQHPFMVVKDLARVFDLPHSHVRVSVPYIGGGYGSKSYTKIEPLVAVGSWFARRAVKVTLSVEESIYTTRADATHTTVRSAFRRDGTLLARDIDIVMDTGAYVDNSGQVLEKAVNRSVGPYRIPNVRVRGRLVYTNTSPASSYRALGAFQVNIATETNIDQAAERLGLDAADLRRMNLVKPGEELLPGRRPMDADLLSDLDAVIDTLSVEPREHVLQGVGFGCGANEGGAFPTSTAQVKIATDGSALVLSGSTELGQGSRTVLSQIAAEELGLELSRVRVFQGDSAGTPFERTTGASRTTTLTGLAVLRACEDAVTKLLAMAADNWGCATEELRRGLGTIEHRDGRRASYAEVVSGWFGPGGGEVLGHGLVRRTAEHEQLPSFWEIGMVGVAVDIDPDTGVTTVDQLVTVGDVGFAINPEGVEGQDLGAAMQGIGGALTEELVYEGQQIRNPNLVEYRVPHVNDVPRRWDALMFERRDGIGPYGAKGVGEGARIPMAGAICSAVARATGVWPTSVPLTPEKVWKMVKDGRRRRDGAEDDG